MGVALSGVHVCVVAVGVVGAVQPALVVCHVPHETGRANAGSGVEVGAVELATLEQL